LRLRSARRMETTNRPDGDCSVPCPAYASIPSPPRRTGHPRRRSG
jgi:hypothetical protein